MKLAQNITEQLVLIQDAIDGEEYFCLICKEKLIAKNKKKEDRIRGIHFSHFGACSGNLETYLHKVAKIILSNEQEILLPRFGRFKLEEAVLEKSFRGIVPDILLTDKNNIHIAIEIFVAHKTEPDKIAKIQINSIAAFEIDLSKLDRNSEYKTIRYEVIDNIRNRTDLNPPVIKEGSDNSYLWVLLLFLGGLLVYIFWPRKKPSRKKHKSFTR